MTLALIASHNPARAGDLPGIVPGAATSATTAILPNAQTTPLTVALSAAGRESSFTTSARTVGRFLAERDIHPAPGDYVSAPVAQRLSPGVRLTYRQVRPVVLVDGGTKQIVHTSAATVGDLLTQQHLTRGPHDQVFPVPRAYLAPNEVVRIDRVDAWTARVKQRLAPHVQDRFDPRLDAGTTRTLAHGAPGVRVATVRYERRNNALPTKKILGYQTLSAPQPRIMVHGSRPYAALQHVAARGFGGALHFAGAALHVIATAYTPRCYGCSGVTASGTHAGLGIIAVDPRVIPLGTHLYIPGYGRAVAGDTGGAIQGHRVDLGFETTTAAMRFGSRQVTVYVVK